MADFSKWSRENLEAMAGEMLQALIRAQDWIERDEGVHGRSFGVGNEVRECLGKVNSVGHVHAWRKSMDGGTYVCDCGAWK